MGSLEAWLLLRSLRTLHLRVPRQSENATILAKWLSGAAGVRQLIRFVHECGADSPSRVKRTMAFLLE